MGTLETLAKVRVLRCDELNPGTEGFVQLELESPAHFSFQDRFILRHSELQENMGGGVYIEEEFRQGAQPALSGSRPFAPPLPLRTSRLPES